MNLNISKLKYLIVAFLSGFVIMVVEITAARILAPTIGVSLYSWTSIIGIILFGIAAGSIAGGKIADLSPNPKTLAKTLIISGILIAIVPVISKKIAPQIILWQLPFIVNIIIITTITLLPSSFALGMIYPIGIKLFVKNFSTIGKESGIFYAISTVGSIIGTFAAGFYFIGTLGSSNTLYFMSFILFFLCVGIDFEKKYLILIAAFISIFPLNKINNNPNVIFASESPYYNIKVVKNENNKYLLLDHDIHSIEGPNNQLVTKYTKAFQIVKLFNENPKNILMIGGGSYSTAKQFVKIFPKSKIDVIEIDPKVTEVAKKFFNLKDFKINTIASDARIYLKKSSKYDIIIGDAYNEFISVPWHLTTVEFIKETRDKLNPKGIYAVNFISTLNGENSQFFQSHYKTFKQVFSKIYILPMSRNPEQIQNIILIGVNSEKFSTDEIFKNEKKYNFDRESQSFLDNIYESMEINENALILKDEKAPVENLMLPIINKYFPEYLRTYNGLIEN